MPYIKLLIALAGLALLTACGGGGTDDSKTAPTATDCTQTPFHADCSADTDATTLRQTMCLANNSADPSCGGILTTYCEANDVTGCPNATTADWLATFTEGDALPTTPNATTRKNQFLQATATGFASGATDGLMKAGNTPSAVEIVTVKFASTDTATGGAAFFDGGVYANGDRVGTDEFFYAGILDGTDLGAPITETITAEANVKWTGQIRTVAEDSAGALTANPTDGFGLDITFDGAKGTITTSFARGPSFIYEIDGMFDENGIITGSVDYGPGDTTNGINTSHSTYSPGTLTGIIGQNGAVGAFHSGRVGVTSAFGFAGGFIALPPAPHGTHDFWLGNARNSDNSAALTIPTVAKLPSATDSHSFITAGATELNLTNAANKNAIRLSDLTSNDNNTSGFAIEEIGSGEDLRKYVGILAGTTVGAPLSTNINTQWTGMLAIQRELFTNKAVTLNVVFAGGAGTIKTQTGGFEYHTTGGSADPNIVIDGAFGTNGVIYGTTTGINTNTFSPGAITGTLTGLIGVNGAVGVFVGNDDADEYGYAGGFVAAPPSE